MGKQIDAAVKLYLAQNGQTVMGRKIEVVLKDDAATPASTRRMAQEPVVTDKVDVLAGFALTPSALATAPIAAKSKTPLVVMSAAAAGMTEASPFLVRTSFALPQVAVGIADWAPRNGIRGGGYAGDRLRSGARCRALFQGSLHVEWRPGHRQPADGRLYNVEFKTLEAVKGSGQGK